MKVHINVKHASNPAADSKLDVLAGGADTVSSIKDRVAALRLIPFPDQDLVFDGKVLEDGQQLADCGVKDLCSLDLVVRASKSTLVQQLSDLLRARDLSCDELGLLYCYKHAVSIGQALKAVGEDVSLQDFIKKEKGFQLDKNTVALVREDTTLKPFSVRTEVELLLKDTATGAMDIKDLSAKFAHKFNVSFSSIVGMKPADFLAKEKELFTVSAKGMVSLKSAPASVNRPTQTRQVHGDVTPSESAQRSPDEADVELPPGLGGVQSAEVETLGSAENQQYVDLHNSVCTRSFVSRVSQVFDEVVGAVSDLAFLNIERVGKGGSIGKGIAISGVVDAEAVFFVRGLPYVGQERWLPPLLTAVASVLAERFPAENGVENIRAAADCVQLSVKGVLNLELRFSPVFASYAQAVQVMGEQGLDKRHFYSASLVEQRVQFIARQPGQVKVTIRLLKWWRDQQEWSSPLVRPRDDILELMAVYSSVQTKPQEQRQAIANVMSLLSRFDELRIIWSNYYTKNDVWAPLLRQRPLLMDPVNPYVNIAESRTFDARELMAVARTTHFFW